MRTITTIGFCLLLSIPACKMGEKEKSTEEVPEQQNEGGTEWVQQMDEEEVEVYRQSLSPIQEDCRFLLNTSYRILHEEDGNNPALYMTKDWFELYEESGDYYLGKADYRVEDFVDDCSGLDTKWIRTNHEALFYIDNSLLESGQIEIVSDWKKHIWPDDEFTFTFEGIEYVLKGRGDVQDSYEVYTDDGLDVYKEVKNYTLSLYAESSGETLLLEVPSFNDTFVEILFIGDIDRDGKPDFVFNASRHYESTCIVVVLSSGEYYEDSVSHDC